MDDLMELKVSLSLMLITSLVAALLYTQPRRKYVVSINLSPRLLQQLETSPWGG